jgi:hypothetical protein
MILNRDSLCKPSTLYLLKLDRVWKEKWKKQYKNRIFLSYKFMLPWIKNQLFFRLKVIQKIQDFVLILEWEKQKTPDQI